MRKISVIVPIYNTEDYLLSCLTSIKKQTIYQELEIILVNDGSKDNSLKLIEKFIQQENNKNIKLINKENEGLSATRNKGIKLATGKYVYFLDSDDFIEEDYLEKMYEVIEKDKSQVLFTNYYFYYVDESRKKAIENIQEDIYSNINGIEFLKKVLMNGFYHSGVCVCLYNREFLIKENLFFNEKLRYSEEQEFTPRVLLKAKNVKYKNLCKYYYRQHSTSMTKKIDIKKVEYLIEVYNSLKKEGEGINIKEEKIFFLEFIDYYFVPKIYNLLTFIKPTERDKVSYKILKNKFKIKYLKNVEKKEKILMMMMMISVKVGLNMCYYFRKIKRR